MTAGGNNLLVILRRGIVYYMERDDFHSAQEDIQLANLMNWAHVAMLTGSTFLSIRAVSALGLLQLRLLPHLLPLPLCSQFPKGSQTRSESHLMDWLLQKQWVRGQIGVLCLISHYWEEDWACETNMRDGAVLYSGTLMYDTASGCDWHWHCQRISLTLNQCAITLIILFNSAYYQFSPWSKFMFKL